MEELDIEIFATPDVGEATAAECHAAWEYGASYSDSTITGNEPI